MSNLLISEKTKERSRILGCVSTKEMNEKEAWELLWLSERQIRRLLREYEKHGEEGLVHKLIWMPSNKNPINKNQIENIVKESRFIGFRPTLMSEKLLQLYGIKVSKETARKIMTKVWVWWPKEKKIVVYRIRRPRRACYGELVQFDWSYHKRFEDRAEECCLLVAIDDATWELVGLMFCENEWYENVAKFWMKYIKKHGVPKSIYLDAFATYKVNHPKATHEKDLVTTFERAMNMLSCQLIVAKSPQAKWRVEKCNETLQDRLVKEMRLLWISTIEKANEFVDKVFIKEFNKKFAVIPQKQENLHTKIWDDINLMWVFARKSLRSLGQDFIIQYKSRYFQIKEWEYKIYPKQRLEVRENIKGKLRILVWEKDIKFKEILHSTVKKNRINHWYQAHKTKKEWEEKRWEELKERRLTASKQRQYHYKAKKLIQQSRLS